VIHVFYAGLLYGTYSYKDFYQFTKDCGAEIYNGGYYHTVSDGKWWRMDGTPCLLEDVPPMARASLLLLT
jgi:hypothetical protein